MLLGRWSGLAAALAGLHYCGSVASGMDFVFVPSANTPPAVIDAFAAAGARWSANLSGDFTLTINIDYAPQPLGTLALTSPVQHRIDYADYRAALASGIHSPDDQTAVGHLAGGTSFNRLINLTVDNPAGRGSLTPYLSDSSSLGNRTVVATQANLRALGFVYGGADASISFNSSYNWSFDPRNVSLSSYDFVGMATHELGHVLGFSSGVDGLDVAAKSSAGPPMESQLANVSPMDLFRYSAQSAGAAGGVMDWTADRRDKYFSVDGGQTSLGSFSTGTNFGDGRQASHWKRGLNLGVMSPGTGRGQTLSISPLDRRVLDVIGYQLGSTWRWTDQPSGSWSDPANWNTNCAPHSTIDAVFDVSRPTSINVGPAAKAGSLTASGGGVTVNTDGGDLAIGGNVTIASGPAALNTSGNGPVGVAGSISNRGSFTHSAGMLAIAGDFNNIAGSAVFNGPQQWGPTSALRVTGGKVTLNTDVGGNGVAPLVVIGGGGSLDIAASQHLTRLDIAGSVLVSGGAGKVIVASDLAIQATGKLDINSSDLIIQTDPANRLAVLASVNSLLASGRSGGTWTGSGIASLAAAQDRAGLMGLAAIVNDRGDGQPLTNTFAGQPVNANSILVKYTLNGDSDLNGIVNADDYFRIDSGRLRGLGGYGNGDFNYDGQVTAADYALINSAFLSQSNLSQPGWTSTHRAVPAPAVPEPTCLTLLAFGGLLLRRRQSHSSCHHRR